VVSHLKYGLIFILETRSRSTWKLSAIILCLIYKQF